MRTKPSHPFIELIKPRILFMQLVTFSFGFALGKRGHMIFVPGFFWGLLGTGLVSAGAASLNHCLEGDVDSRMERTKNRPIPTGSVSRATAFVYGLVLIALGGSVLVFQVNGITAFLALLTVHAMVNY